jgi:5-methylcytosine-specific restriction endonuclease McrA
METLPTSHAEAMRQGSRLYLGLPCAKGHGAAPRYTHNRACAQCEVDYSRAYKLARADREADRKRQWKADNRERVKAQRRRYHDRHPDEIRARKKDYRARDPNGTLALRASWAAVLSTRKRVARALQRELDTVRALARLRELEAMRYAAAKVAGSRGETLSLRELRDRVKKGKHRAKARGLPHTLRAWQLAEIGDAQGWACAHCGATGELVLDHIHPISKGGAHAAANVQWLCPFHNADKGNRTETEYRALRGIPAATPWDVL